MFFYIAITSLLGLAVSLPVDEIAVPNYGFNYAVRDPGTGDNKAQTETRDGGVVKGSYSLQEPDGTLRVVDYYADPVHGFNAVVRRDGPSGLHPAPHSSPAAVAPMYHASMHPTRQQIGGHAASIVPVGPVSIDSIPSYAGLVGLGGYAHSSLGASHGLSTSYGLGSGYSTSVGHGMVGAGYGH